MHSYNLQTIHCYPGCKRIEPKPEMNDMYRLIAIQAAHRAGLKIVLATGREIAKVEPYLKYLALDLPIVTLNGAEIWIDNNNLYKRNLVELDMVKEIFSLAKLHNVPYWGFAIEGTYYKFSFDTDLEHFGWLKFLFQTENDGQMTELTVIA